VGDARGLRNSMKHPDIARRFARSPTITPTSSRSTAILPSHGPSSLGTLVTLGIL